jgi:hypothetical protein
MASLKFTKKEVLAELAEDFVGEGASNGLNHAQLVSLLEDEGITAEFVGQRAQTMEDLAPTTENMADETVDNVVRSTDVPTPGPNMENPYYEDPINRDSVKQEVDPYYLEPVEAPRVLQPALVSGQQVLAKMTRNNFRYDAVTNGKTYTFTKEHPFVVMKTEDFSELVNRHEGFRQAFPDEAKVHYS